MTFEESMATERDVFIPDDAESAQVAIEIAMKAAFDAGRVSALDEVEVSVRVIREPYT